MAILLLELLLALILGGISLAVHVLCRVALVVLIIWVVGSSPGAAPAVAVTAGNAGTDLPTLDLVLASRPRATALVQVWVGAHLVAVAERAGTVSTLRLRHGRPSTTP